MYMIELTKSEVDYFICHSSNLIMVRLICSVNKIRSLNRSEILIAFFHKSDHIGVISNPFIFAFALLIGCFFLYFSGSFLFLLARFLISFNLKSYLTEKIGQIMKLLAFLKKGLLLC